MAVGWPIVWSALFVGTAAAMGAGVISVEQAESFVAEQEAWWHEGTFQAAVVGKAPVGRRGTHPSRRECPSTVGQAGRRFESLRGPRRLPCRRRRLSPVNGASETIFSLA